MKVVLFKERKKKKTKQNKTKQKKQKKNKRKLLEGNAKASEKEMNSDYLLQLTTLFHFRICLIFVFYNFTVKLPRSSDSHLTRTLVNAFVRTTETSFKTCSHTWLTLLYGRY